MKTLKQLKQMQDRALNAVVVVLMIGMIFSTFLQVVGRYIFSNPPYWSEELARYLSVWVVFLGSAIAFRLGSHLGVDFFVEQMPASIGKLVNTAIYLILLVMLLILVVKGFAMAKFVSRQLSPAMRISMAIPYLAVPVGSGMMFLEVLISFINTCWSRKQL